MHLLVASYLGYKPPPPPESWPAIDADAPDGPWRPPAGTSAIPAPQAVRDAKTDDEAIDAFERMFFGDVAHV